MRTRLIGLTSHEDDETVYAVMGRSETRIWYAHVNWVNPDFWAKVDAKRRGQLNKGR